MMDKVNIASSLKAQFRDLDSTVAVTSSSGYEFVLSISKEKTNENVLLNTNPMLHIPHLIISQNSIAFHLRLSNYRCRRNAGFLN